MSSSSLAHTVFVLTDMFSDSLTSGGSWLMAPVAALVLSNPDYLKRRMTWSAVSLGSYAQVRASC